MALPAKQMVLFVWGSRPLLSAMKYSIIIYLDPDYSKRAVLLYNTNKPMGKHDDIGRIKLKKIIDKKYPEWKYYDIFKFENQEVTKNV